MSTYKIGYFVGSLYSPDMFTIDGEVTNESMRESLSNYMAEFRDHLVRVLTVLPRQ